jgi:hypothetical protein
MNRGCVKNRNPQPPTHTTATASIRVCDTVRVGPRVPRARSPLRLCTNFVK